MAGFSTRVCVAKKQYTCWTCRRAIQPGKRYAASAGTNHSGEFTYIRMCIECLFLMTQKTGPEAETVAPGCFTEQKIPNFLRKLRTEYRCDPAATVKRYKLLEVPPEAPAVRKQIIVKASEFERRIFHAPESRFKKEQFPAGGELTIRAGVTGKSRKATIIGVWSVDGSGFGCSSRQVALLTKPKEQEK